MLFKRPLRPVFLDYCFDSRRTLRLPVASSGREAVGRLPHVHERLLHQVLGRPRTAHQLPQEGTKPRRIVAIERLGARIAATNRFPQLVVAHQAYSYDVIRSKGPKSAPRKTSLLTKASAPVPTGRCDFGLHSPAKT